MFDLKIIRFNNIINSGIEKEMMKMYLKNY